MFDLLKQAVHNAGSYFLRPMPLKKNGDSGLRIEVLVVFPSRCHELETICDSKSLHFVPFHIKER